MRLVIIALSLLSLSACTSIRTETVDKGKYVENGATYRHLTTTVTMERDVACVGTCQERP